MRVSRQVGESRRSCSGDRLHLHETCNELNLNMNMVKTGVAGSTLVVISEHLPTAGADISALVEVHPGHPVRRAHLAPAGARAGPQRRGRRRHRRRPVMTDVRQPRGRGRRRDDPARPAPDERPQRRRAGGQIRQAAQEAAARRDVSAVIVYGGEKVFAAGADIKEMRAMSYTDMVDRSAALQSSFTAVAPSAQAHLAAVTGYALGGGCELALCCDFRIAGESARLGQPEILLGISPAPAAPSVWPGWSARRGPRTRVLRPLRRRRGGAARSAWSTRSCRDGDVYVAARRRMARYVGGPALRAAGGQGGDRPRAGDRPDTGLEIERCCSPGCSPPRTGRSGWGPSSRPGPARRCLTTRPPDAPAEVAHATGN